ncbi:MAG: hypothetical protein HYX89_05475, partial [Chloroflexi bacterium]|nr:hypothetical protein [Chloroflexota bacterium]
MNTVFKFYLQVWVLFALASALALPHLVRRLQSLRWPRGDIWWAVFTLLVVGVLLYPVAATAARTNDRFDRFGPTDDGAAYMSRAVWIDKTPMELRWDADAIQWLLENVSGSPVILEANGRLYSWFSRVSVYTGLPTVVGWDWHQRQQRGQVVPGVVERRLADVQTLYSDPSPSKALQLLGKYRVQYIYVGDLERAYYPAPGLAKFDQMVGSTLDIAYTNDHVKIYRVREQPNSTS